MKLQIATNATTAIPESRQRHVFVKAVPDLNRLQLLTESERQEVLEFLKIRLGTDRCAGELYTG